jgi:NTE family protein
VAAAGVGDIALFGTAVQTAEVIIVRGLLLTGGGARGAYQAGVLTGIAKLLDEPDSFPFPVLTGTSAGAINTVGLASRAPSFAAGTKLLAELWGNLEMDHVFRTDSVRLAQIGGAWLKNVALGGFLGHDGFNALLDPQPLRALLERTFDFAAMRRQLAAGNLQGVAVQAADYGAGASVSFLEAKNPDVAWARARRLGVQAVLTVDHVMASTAIPIIFPAVRIGNSYYGDGSVRMTSPFSPAIHLGASRILAVGVRKQQPVENLLATLNQSAPRPTLASIVGNLLNAVFLDAIDGDLERLNRINHTLALIPREAAPERIALRPIEALMISPSEDLGALAKPHLKYFPAELRHLLRGLGADQPEGADFLSYILFDRHYCGELIELGIRDVMKQEAALQEFFQ